MSRRFAAALALLLGFCGLAEAVLPGLRAKEDAKRFGLDKPEPSNSYSRPAAKLAIKRYNALRLKTLGAGGQPVALDPLSAALAYAAQNKALFGVDPSELVLASSKTVGPITHLVLTQRHAGVPVEFAKLKVHVGSSGDVLAAEPALYPVSQAPSPVISKAQASAAAAADAGGAVFGGELAYLPVYATGEVRLAWKFSVAAAGALWRYYVDAANGAILFRHNALTYVTSGVVTGQIQDVYATSAAVVVRGMPNQTVYVSAAAVPTVTQSDGGYTSATDGKIFTSLQGPHAYVVHSATRPLHYDNAAGVWFTAATPVSSPHPYPPGASVNSVVFSGVTPVVTSGLGTVVKALPIVYGQVGTITLDGLGNQIEPTDNDRLEIVSPAGDLLGSYIGRMNGLYAAAVNGVNPQITLRLRANERNDLRQNGFDVAYSSFLALPASGSPNVGGSGGNFTFTWTPSMSAEGRIDEINAFYHINKQRDFFNNDVNKSSQAVITATTAKVRYSTLFNAFFDPDFQDLTFGGGADFALDPTVIRHEYTHFVVDKIFQLPNFGQSGAISEGLADYFALSALGVSDVGRITGASTGDVAFRNLACGGAVACVSFPTNWVGEIHADSLAFSQALWEIRNDGAIGQACGDELVFQALFFYPESFSEFLDAMLQVNAQSAALAPKCAGSAATRRAQILSHFQTPHGIRPAQLTADAFEPNDGFESATDVSTMTSLLATIFPVADADVYSFSASPGQLAVSMDLPALGGGVFAAYSIGLFDSHFNQFRVANTPFGTADPALANPSDLAFPYFCPAANCQALSSNVSFTYNVTRAGQYFLMVTATFNDQGSPSATASSTPYSLKYSYNRDSVFRASVVTALPDNDTIQFTVAVSSFFQFTNYSFAYAQLRDQSGLILPQTATNGASPYLTLVSSTSSGGQITGRLKITPGFGARFPSVGTVQLEVFGYDRLQVANLSNADPSFSAITQSLGVSQGFNLTSSQSSLSAWNNVFNPAKGEKATLKYETASAGQVRIRLYTMAGALVATLVDSNVPAGKGSVDWSGMDAGGKTVASGIYIANFEAPGFHKTQKVIVVK